MSNTIKISSPLQTAHKIKQNLEDQIRCITNQPEILLNLPLIFLGIESYLLKQHLKLSFLSEDKVLLVSYSRILISRYKPRLHLHLYKPEARLN